MSEDIKTWIIETAEVEKIGGSILKLIYDAQLPRTVVVGMLDDIKHTILHQIHDDRGKSNDEIHR